MNFMEYVCRGIVRSEDAIRCLNKKVVKLAKCNNQLATAVICMGISGLLTLSVLAAHEKEIQELRKQVSDLSAKADVTNATEERNQQEGA